MPQAITIDDLPIDVSVQWADNISLLDRKYLDETKYILHQTEITVVEPTYPSLTYLLQEHNRAPTWSYFTPPPHFTMQSNRFFRSTLIPSLDPESSLETYENALEELYSAHIDIPIKTSESIHALLKTLSFISDMLRELQANILRCHKG